MWHTIGQLDWFFDDLPQSWSVTLDAARPGYGGANIRAFHRRAPELFRVLGAEVGWSTGDVFDGPPDPALTPRGRLALDELKTLGVRNGCPLDTTPGGRACILVGTVGPSGWTNGRSVNTAIERAAADNQAKLARAVADERHLLVWVDSTDTANETAIGTFSVPHEVPELPPVIDKVWVALWMRGMNPQTNIFSLWHLAAGGHWEIVQVPAVRRCASNVGVVA